MTTTLQSGKRTFSTEFPNFGELDVKLPEGFSDTSWHNDVMPSFTCELGCGRYLVIWINFADEDMRESGGSRFAIVLHGKDEVAIDEFASDDWQEILEWATLALEYTTTAIADRD